MLVKQMRHVFPNSESHINQKLFIHVQQKNIKGVILVSIFVLLN